MAKVRARKDTNRLFIDFRYRGVRARELTALEDNPSNRRMLEKLAARIEAAITDGSFDYRTFFPHSRAVATLDPPANPVGRALGNHASAPPVPFAKQTETPTLREFAEKWFSENDVRWRTSYRKTVRDILDLHILKQLGDRAVGQIAKEDILAFRSSLAKVRGRKNKEGLSPARINYIMKILAQIMTEAADRFQYTNPYRNIKPLKIPRIDIEPFSIADVGKILDTVRTDYRNYLTVRFLTGMRTGEIDGLKWQYVDFENNQILVRETIVDGNEEYTKTDGSQREIHMSPPVREALLAQRAATLGKCPWVFANEALQPIDKNNFARRVWYPLLRYLDLKARRPYQTRHTAATLWLASGENPQWIARQMGHASTEMLFRVYARFVPNLTRRDGSAFETLLAQTSLAAKQTGAAHPSEEPQNA